MSQIPNYLPTPPDGPPDGRNLINLIEDLSWPISWRVAEQADTLYVESDPIGQRHCITTPVRPVRWLEVQHELAHCYLAETVHPLFSGTYFKCGTPEHLMQSLSFVWRSATDWFVDDIIYTRWPKAGVEEIKEHLYLMLDAPAAQVFQSPDMAWMCVLFYAQLLHYGHGKKLAKKVRKKAKGIDQLSHKTFLKFPPNRPSIQTLTGLMNSILRIATPQGLHVKLIEEQGMEVLEIKTPSG